MKKFINCGTMVLAASLVCSAAILSSCAADNGTDRLAELLYSNSYEAQFDFIFTGTVGEPLVGSATAKKGENVTLTFSSPAVFEGMTVESGLDGTSDTLMFGYYGMKAPLPEKSLTKIDLAMTFFSDDTAEAIACATSENVSDYVPTDGGDVNSDGAMLKSCVFELDDGNTVCNIVYDAASGMPYSYTAQRNGCLAELTFVDITFSE